ncbi:serine hydrolase [Amycolatopsis sp. La24]|uniref:serine hydrolase domain-containing protein n=1 Tax=Amycolatopsis sp. La24 TaxID=3028304 RepID=UPI0023B18317|nr:serine hydrolase [Amycolatopsis sp. La24]
MTNPYTVDNAYWSRGYVDPAFVRLGMTRARETGPTRRVWRGSGPRWDLPEDHDDLDNLLVTPRTGDPAVKLTEFLAAAETDAILVAHRGKIVYERYFHGMRPHDVHLSASVAKSWTGLLAALLIDEGVLDADQPLSHYAPELGGTAFGDATIHHLLHMGTVMDYGGRPFCKPLEAQRYFAAVGIVPRPAGFTGPTSVKEHLATARAVAPPGTEFRYDNGNTEAVAEALRRVTGVSLADLWSERVWARLGAEEDGAYCLDSTGTEIACGRYSATLRDLVRVGEMLRRGGTVGDRQLVPERVVADLTNVPPGPAQRALPTGAARPIEYHNFWWVPGDGHGTFGARGIHGQRLQVSPGRELVIAHYGSHVMSPSVPVPALEAVFAQIGDHLTG